MEFNKPRFSLNRISLISGVIMELILIMPGLISHENKILENIGYLLNDPVPFSGNCLSSQASLGYPTLIYAKTATNPVIAVNPKHHHHIVAAWQQDQISNGGALECGIAYSKDGGKKWQRAIVPFQRCLGGISQRIDDVWLTFANDGKRVYLSTLIENVNLDPDTTTQSGVAVSISHDNGAHWSSPIILFSSPNYLNEVTGLLPEPEKPSITADRNFPSEAYCVWDTFTTAASSHTATYFSLTRNKGKSWTPATLLYDPFLDPNLISNGDPNDCQTFNNVIVVLPKATPEDKHWQEDDWGDEVNKSKRFSGDILNFMERIYASPGTLNAQYVNDEWPYTYTLFDLAVTRSTNRGATWNQTATQINFFGTSDPKVYSQGYDYTGVDITGGNGEPLRTGDIFPSYNVNPKNGFLYVAYQTGEFRADGLPVIALQTSRDGGYNWSAPTTVSKTPATAPNPQAFTPSVAVDGKGRVGILYYDTRYDTLDNSSVTPTDAWLAIYKEVRSFHGGSTGIGLDFEKEIRLTHKSFNAQNGPFTVEFQSGHVPLFGNMSVGDYIFLDTHNKHFYAVFTKPENGPFSPPFIIDPLVALDDNIRQFPFFSKVHNN